MLWGSNIVGSEAWFTNASEDVIEFELDCGNVDLTPCGVRSDRKLDPYWAGKAPRKCCSSPKGSFISPGSDCKPRPRGAERRLLPPGVRPDRSPDPLLVEIPLSGIGSREKGGKFTDGSNACLSLRIVNTPQ